MLICDDQACAHMLQVKRCSLLECSGHFHVIVTHLDALNRWTAVPLQPQGDHPLGRVWFLVVRIFSSFTRSHWVLRKVENGFGTSGDQV